MNSFFQNMQEFLGRLSRGQQLAIGGVLIGSIALLIGIAYYVAQPDYALLFGRLDSSDANKVVETLKEQRIPYQLRDNGSSIYVPNSQVYELRLRFAGEGVVTDGTTGYELFDQSTLGMTDFVQKLKLKRALEGELARTISSIRQVEMTRVHLVVPERSPFRDSQAEPSASVVLQLRGSNQLTPAQIEGVTALVAGAVEGLNPTNVTILDTRGNLLSNPEARDANVLLSNTQMRMQQTIETHLTGKGQSMLDQVLGPGNALVRVAATLDQTRSIAEREIIDPESATVISEERLNEANNGNTANSTLRNFELSRTRERNERGAGEISYLTVSVILNYKRVPPPAGTGDTEVTLIPYTPQELQEVEELVKNAVGFHPERNDRFAIHQTRFDTSVDEEIAAQVRAHQQQEQLNLYLRYLLMILGIALALWLLRSASKQVTATREEQMRALGGPALQAQLSGRGPDGTPMAQLPPAEDDDDLVLVEDMYTSKLSPEARARLKAKHLMFEEIKRHVDENPAVAADLIRSWLVDDLKSKN